jgi:hypothetical protein
VETKLRVLYLAEWLKMQKWSNVFCSKRKLTRIRITHSSSRGEDIFYQYFRVSVRWQRTWSVSFGRCIGERGIPTAENTPLKTSRRFPREPYRLTPQIPVATYAVSALTGIARRMKVAFDYSGGSTLRLVATW